MIKQILIEAGDRNIVISIDGGLSRDKAVDFLVMFFRVAEGKIGPEIIARILRKEILEIWIKAKFIRRDNGRITQQNIEKLIKERLSLKKLLPQRKKGDPISESFYLAIEELARKMHGALSGRCNSPSEDCYLQAYCIEECFPF